jgi:hypothetical protein
VGGGGGTTGRGYLSNNHEAHEEHEAKKGKNGVLKTFVLFVVKKADRVAATSSRAYRMPILTW